MVSVGNSRKHEWKWTQRDLFIKSPSYEDEEKDFRWLNALKTRQCH